MVCKMALFGKITQLLKSFQASAIENPPVASDPLDLKEKYDDATASAETADLVMSGLGQQFAAQRAQFINTDGVKNKDGSYTVSVHPTDLGIKRWSKDVTPQEVTQKATEKLLDDFGIKDENFRKQALTKLAGNKMVFELGAEKTRKTIKTDDFGERDLMLVGTNKLGGVDVQLDAEQVNWLINLAKLEKFNESAYVNFLNYDEK